ncbi:butyrophilin subfamily 1 member A1-like [Trachinotus anak]|uniref:butyrophilin subfamily 1 member A1-like n=1 Tax=Trachinotus anak TaxID=443729 RepID=UPI0039F1CFD1
MKLPGLLVLYALGSAAGKALQSGSPGQVFAAAGEDVVLPCGLATSVRPSGTITVEWSRGDGPSSSTVHVLRNGEELEKEKSEEYRGRTAVTEDASLTLREVTRRDSGTYRCSLLGESSLEVFVSLSVAQVSEVNVTVQPASSNELLVRCTCSGWGPKPRVSLLDAKGNVLPAKNEVSAGADDLYSVRADLNLAAAAGSGTLICRVEIPALSLVKEEMIHIPDQWSRPETEAGPGYWVVPIIVLFFCVTAVVIVLVLRAEGRRHLKAFCSRLIPELTGGEEAEPLLQHYRDIFQVDTTGASEDTARIHRVSVNGQQLDGVTVSEHLAERDLSEMNKYKDVINRVGAAQGVHPALIAAIISRQSLAGTLLNPDGSGKFCSDCFGLMQINKAYHDVKGEPYSQEHVQEGVKLLVEAIRTMWKEKKKWTPQQQLKGALASYIAGPERILRLEDDEDVDSETPNKDFANDVVARARWFAGRGFAFNTEKY